MPLRAALHPLALLLVPVLASALAWSVPGASTSLRGFAQRSELSLGGLTVLVGWYLLCAGLLVLGYRCGAATPRLPALARFESDPTLERWLFRLVWVLATVGVAYSVVRAASTVDVLAALGSNTGNDLKSALGGEAGPATLRYATAVAFPMGVLLWRRGLVGPAEVLWSTVLLAANALFASRLAVLMAAVVLLFLYRAWRPEARVRWRTLAVAALVLLGALTLLNSLRNENYYTAHGVQSPLAANGYQLLTYLGTPFQVSLGVADAIAAGRYPEQYPAVHATGLWVPTFLRSSEHTEQTPDDYALRHETGQDFVFSTGSLPRGDERYASTVDVADTLTTNSAFADVLSDFGYWGLLGLALTTGALGVLLGHLGRYRSVVAAGCGVVGYGVAEMWRTYLFGQGIVVFLLVAVLGGAVALSCLRTASPRGPHRRREHRMIYVDDRRSGAHGVGRFSREVLARLPTRVPGPVRRLPLHGSATTPLDCARPGRLRASGRDVIFSPGANAGLSRAVQLVTVHDLIHLADGSELKRFYYERVVRPQIVRTGSVLTVSDASRVLIEDWLGADAATVDVRVVGNGCSPDFVPEGAAEAFDRPTFRPGQQRPRRTRTSRWSSPPSRGVPGSGWSWWVRRRRR